MELKIRELAKDVYIIEVSGGSENRRIMMVRK